MSTMGYIITALDNERANMESLQAENQRLKSQLDELREKLKAGDGKKEEAPWFPKVGESYWLIFNDGTVSGGGYNYSDGLAQDRARIGNVFKTKEDAEFAAERLKILAEMRQFSCAPTPGMERWVIVCRSPNGEGIVPDHYDGTYFDLPMFKSYNQALECIKAIGEERLRKYWFGGVNLV